MSFLTPILESLSHSWDYLWTKEGAEDFSTSTVESLVTSALFHKFLGQFGFLRPVLGGVSLLFSAQTGWDLLQGKGSKAMLARFLGDSFGGAIYGGLYKSAVHFVTKNKIEWGGIHDHILTAELETSNIVEYQAIEGAGHRENNKNNIRELAMGLFDGNYDPNRKFLVLGGGIMHEQPDVDYPLAEMAKVGETSIVDNNQATLVGAISTLPVEFWQNIKGHRDDITTIIGIFYPAVYGILSEASTPDIALANYRKLLTSLDPPIPNFAKYTFGKTPKLVVSSMVLSQLHFNPMNSMREGFMVKFPGASFSDGSLLDEERQFIGKLVEAHIAGLKKLADQGSLVYLSSDVTFMIGGKFGTVLFKSDGTPVIKLKEFFQPDDRLITFQSWSRPGTNDLESNIEALGILPSSTLS